MTKTQETTRRFVQASARRSEAGSNMSYPFRRIDPFAVLMVCAALAPGLAMAQSWTKSGLSPVAPPTLKEPVFDTTKPDYNVPDVKKAGSTVVAEVDGQPITLGQVADAIKELPPTMQKLPYSSVFQIVQNRLIARGALVIRARQQGLDLDPAVGRRMKTASDNVLAEEFLRREGERRITEQALLERYAKDISGKPGPEEIHLHVIMVPTEAEGQNIIKDLQAGADFATLARQTSKDSSASVGGDIGFLTRASLNPELAGAAFAATPGQIVPVPIYSARSWFVVKVGERRQQQTPTFAVVREKLEQELLQTQAVDVSKQALTGMKIRFFTMSGKEVERLPDESEGAKPQ